MRRLVVSVGVAFGLVLIGAGPASAEPVPETSTAAEATPGKQVCKVTDSKLDELSGIVATDDGFIVINDSAESANRKRVFYLDRECEVTDSVSYTGNGPRDTEDLVLSPDGETLWIADIGDNQKNRQTVALWSMPADGSERPEIHRLTYPDGAHDAEAMLLNGDGTPLIVTKEVGRPAAVYQPTAKLEANNSEGVPMKKVAEITVPPSRTPGNAIARLGRGTISGGSVASGGAKVVLRTYTDALEWSVAGGDVVKAVQGEARVTPLPNEQQGEAITYSPDGKVYYTVSDMQGDTEAENSVLEYTPVARTAVTKAAAGEGGGGEGGGSFLDRFSINSINDVTYLVGGIGVLGAILVGLGVFGIMRARKQAPPPAPATAKGDGDKPDPDTELLAVGGAASGAGVYGRPAGAKPAGGPGVYGRPGAGAQGSRPGPGQQGGRSGGGGVYGGKGGAGQPGRPPGGAPGGGRPAGGRGGAAPSGPVPAGGRPSGGRSGGEYGNPPARSGPPGGGRGGQPGRPAGGQPARPAGGQPARPAGGQPARPAGGRPADGQPGRPAGGGQGRPAGGQSPRPGGGGQPGRGGGGGGVYGSPPQGPGPARGASGQPPRPSGFFGGGGHSDPRGADGYADQRNRDFDAPGYR